MLILLIHKKLIYQKHVTLMILLVHKNLCLLNLSYNLTKKFYKNNKRLEPDWFDLENHNYSIYTNKSIISNYYDLQ